MCDAQVVSIHIREKDHSMTENEVHDSLAFKELET